MVVESDDLDSVMVVEWLVTNATESAMTLSVQRNIIQTVDPSIALRNRSGGRL